MTAKIAVFVVLKRSYISYNIICVIHLDSAKQTQDLIFV